MISSKLGQTIAGRYLIKELLGIGAMADVFRCEDLQLGRQVAVKVLHENLVKNPGVVERFERETYASGTLQHPNIVDVYTSGEWEGVPYMAMELVDGPNLKQLINDKAPLAPLEVIDLTIGILKALRYAHKRGLVHRDIKPHNILVADGSIPKVTDFGIARILHELQITDTGHVIGTAAYIAPEQAKGDPVNNTTDFYSLGVLMFELLTGHLPFQAEQPVAVALKHVTEEPPAPSVVNANIPKDLERVVLHALQKESDRRFCDADQFITALRTVKKRIENDEPIPVTDPWPEPHDDTSEHDSALHEGVSPAEVERLRKRERELARKQVIAETKIEAERESKARARARLWAALLALVVAALLTIYAMFGRKAEVPNVTGLTTAAATQKLREAGFSPLSDERFSSTVETGRVAEQVPVGGQEKTRGSQIRILISKGESRQKVPNVVGQLRDSARKALTKDGFTRIDEQLQSSSSVADGIVLAVVPGPGAEQVIDDRITLVISSGRNGLTNARPVAVPSFRGISESEASRRANQLGLQLHIVNRKRKGNEKLGSVVEQDPLPKASVDPGTVLQITIARRSKKESSSLNKKVVSIPNVINHKLVDARSELEDLGLKVKVTSVPTSKSSEVNLVLSQNPITGQATIGTSIEIVVGKKQ